MNQNLARRHANVWLTMNAGHLLMVKNPELLLEDLLQWRFDVVLSIPQHEQLDARTGEVVEPLLLVEELKANASALAVR